MSSVRQDRPSPQSAPSGSDFRSGPGGPMAFRPYLFFGGNCREAFTRYEEIFGGELTLVTMKDVPSDEPPPAEMADVIIHAALTFGDDMLMASDDPTTDKFGPVQGMMVSYQVADP